MPKVQFKTSSGEVRTVDADEGESLMQVAVRNGVPGILGECGGELSCATCHMYIAEPWATHFSPASDDEQDLLEMADDRRPESRLGCQLKVSESADGLVAEVAQP
ncbi:2Fe-2S iron-sulfur cluster-binding protein [Streptomyces arenae]|uniref:2Fe-2S iron-sulfur cluster-binding protein n=1 Tax=Streptomyces arenae TaxID=29301 RepID=UPI002659323D|nr:2Fe-2S iron-sulfur cluster-binding protein [Streptomyces arenae]MCG7207376.1 2Fe-2S iron-sulfur cluster-binding protein [Streptomyces arenae]